MKKKLFWLTTMILVFCLMSVNALAISVDETVSQISQSASDDGYRFMLVGEAGITDEIRNDLATNDEMYLEPKPEGSVTIQVLDADTGKPIKGAQCFLSFSSSMYTVSDDGSEEQTSNPFLLFNLGMTPDGGEVKFTDTYFYSTTSVALGESYFADCVGNYLASIVDEDPEVTIDYAVQSWFVSSEPELYQQLIDKLGGRTSLKFSEYKELLTSVAGDRYTEFLRNLFDDKFSYFSDSVMVEVDDKPQYQKLISDGKKKLTIGELRTYIDQSKELFDKYVAGRTYRDFGGFTSAYSFYYEPPYDYVMTYKNGTTSSESTSPYLGAWIFDSASSYNNPSATGYAIALDGFSYKAYAYAEGYKDGLAMGAYIQQDLIDKDITIKIYMSKDMSPLVAYAKDNAVFGTLTDKGGSPVQGAEIRINGTDFSTHADENGDFSFTGLKLDGKSVGLTVIDPENGEVISGVAELRGKKYALDKIPMDMTGENGVYRLSLVQGKGAPKFSAMWIVLIAVLLIGGAGLAIVLGKKKKKQAASYAGPIAAPRPMQNGYYAPQVNPAPAPYMNGTPVINQQYVPYANAAPTPNPGPETKPNPPFCAYCGAKLTPDTAFCSSCGAKIEPPSR